MKTYLLKAGVRQAIAKAGETDIAVAYNAKTWMDEYPAGNPQLMVTTPGGKRVPVTVEAVDNLITGQVPNELLAGPGVYSYVFVWTSGSTQLESGRCECLVLGSNLAKDLVHDSRRTPDWAERIFQAAEVIEGAIPGMMEARNTTADNAAEAIAAAEEATESKNAAAGSAEAAAASEENIETILTNMDQTITDARDAMNGIEEQKDTMIASIASVAGQGTDTTLTQPGVAADAKAAGDAIGDLKSAITSLDDGISIVDKNITWTNAWVNVSGKLVSSSATKTGLFEMQAGETLTVGTRNPNITIIGSTTSSSVAVGDTITIIQKTSSTDQYEEYSYTATGTINIVVCVLAANYNLIVTKKSGIRAQIDEITNDVENLNSNITTLTEQANKATADIGKYKFEFSSSGSAHSSSSDRISINIPHNNALLIVVSLNITPSGTYECWAAYSDGTTERLLTGYFGRTYTITPPKNITSLGFSVGSQSGAYVCTIELDTNTPTEIVALNGYGYNALLQAKRTINLSSNAYLSNTQPLVLLHFSDIHGASENLRRIVAFRDEYANLIDDTICTGDMVTDRFSDGMGFWNAVPGAENIMMAIGNHDALAAASGYDWTDLKSQADQYARYIAPYVSNWDCEYSENKTYYYKDYDSKKVRLICLNCMLTGDDNTAQLTWFASALNGAITNDYYVIVAVHYPISNHTTVSCGFSSIDKTPYQTQDRISDDYMSAVNTFIGNGGRFVCYITGHTHTDFILKSSNYNGQLCVVIDAASYSAANADSDTQRTIGTKSQDCANLFVFDSASEAIKIIRVGADIDHYMRPKNDITFKLSDLSIITQS